METNTISAKLVVEEFPDWNLWQSIFKILDLYYVGQFITWTAITAWIGCWAMIAFMFTDAGQHLLQPLSAFSIAGGTIWALTYLFIAAYCCSLNSRAEPRIVMLAYHLIRWPYFVGLLATDYPLAWSFAFSFELIVLPTLLGFVGLMLYTRHCYTQMKKELEI